MVQKRVLVTGAGGFIGYHLVLHLQSKGHWVRGADIVEPRYAETSADEFMIVDLRDRDSAARAVCEVDEVYALAANMGGMGYISKHHSTILHDNLLININTIDAVRRSGTTKRILYTSSACVYPEYLQDKVGVSALREEDAYPAQPQDAYGWEKLITERMMAHNGQDYGIETRVVRLHNIYGPYGAWDGGREKAPAAVCRKVAIAKLTGRREVEIWGDGKQTRSFCYIEDCLLGIERMMQSDYGDPINLGQDRKVSINELVDMTAEIAGVKVIKRHVEGPQGVRGRNSDNTRLMEVLGWQPEISLEDGIYKTYTWIEKQVEAGLVCSD